MERQTDLAPIMVIINHVETGLKPVSTELIMVAIRARPDYLILSTFFFNRPWFAFVIVAVAAGAIIIVIAGTRVNATIAFANIIGAKIP